MKICLMPHPNTVERFSYLVSNFRVKPDIEICFPEEDPLQKNADIFILEEELPFVTERLLSAQQPPVIVIPKEGVSEKYIRYLPDFSKQFPKLFKELTTRNASVCLELDHQLYFYNQNDILYLIQDGSLCICLRQGNKVFCKTTLCKISGQLSPTLFFPVGEKAYVNIEYVSEIKDGNVRMQNGMDIPFETSMTEQIKNAYFKTKYLRNQPVC